MTESDLKRLVDALLRSPQMQALWQIRDRGMPVFAHTVDVALLCLEAFPDQRERYPSLDLATIVLGSLLHDLSKLTARRELGVSHSHIMTCEPHLAIAEAITLLDWGQYQAGVQLHPELVDHIWHVVVSHHGPWGKVKPATPEAQLVHECDLYSATHHRIAPVDANDILALLKEGRRLAQVGVQFGVSRDVIKSRLRDACAAEQVHDWPDLLALWEQRGRVAIGTGRRARQLERVRALIGLARTAPDCLTTRIDALVAQLRSPAQPALGLAMV